MSSPRSAIATRADTRSTVPRSCACIAQMATAATGCLMPDGLKKRTEALRRYGAPEEVARVIVSLLMPAASHITGAVIRVDGI